MNVVRKLLFGFGYCGAIVALSSVLAWLLWIAGLADSGLAFDKVFSRLVLILVATTIGVAIWKGAFSVASLGFSKQPLGPHIKAFSVALLLLAPPVIFFLVVGFRVSDTTVELLSLNFLGLVVVLLLSSLLVGLFEESLFRGLFFSSLINQNSFVVSAFVVSAVYALVHFLRVEEPVMEVAPTGFTGLILAGSGFTNLLDISEYWDSFVSLFLLGWLLCYVRQSYGLWYCVTLHAAWVFGIRLFKELTVRDIVNPYLGWVGTYDNFVGHFVSLWILFLILALYLFRLSQKNQAAVQY